MHLIIFFAYLALALINFFSTVRAIYNQALLGVLIAGTMAVVFFALAICKFVIVAIVAGAAWLATVGWFIHDTDKAVAGKSSWPRSVLTWGFVGELAVFGGVPLAVVLAIWGGIFWW